MEALDFAEEGGVHEDEIYFKTVYIAVFLLLIIYTMVGSYIESTKAGYLHETGVAIIIGMLISLF